MRKPAFAVLLLAGVSPASATEVAYDFVLPPAAQDLVNEYETCLAQRVQHWRDEGRPEQDQASVLAPCVSVRDDLEARALALIAEEPDWPHPTTPEQAVRWSFRTLEIQPRLQISNSVEESGQ